MPLYTYTAWSESVCPMRCSAEMQRSISFVVLLLSCFWAVVTGYPFRTPLDLDVTPRVTVLSSGLQGCRRFQSSAVNYSTMLLEADSERLYVGARGAIFALNASDISSSSALKIEWEASPEQKSQCLLKGKDNKTECFNHIRLLQRFNSSHLYICGTHAFSPLCAYIDVERFEISSHAEEGRDKCPYGPTTGYTALIIDQQIYTASQYEFRSFPDIRRNSPSPTLKTEDAPTRWLNALMVLSRCGSCLYRRMWYFQKDFQISIYLTTEQFSTLPQSLFNELWPREDSGIPGSCSHVAFLHDRALTFIFG